MDAFKYKKNQFVLSRGRVCKVLELEMYDDSPDYLLSPLNDGECLSDQCGGNNPCQCAGWTRHDLMQRLPLVKGN